VTGPGSAALLLLLAVLGAASGFAVLGTVVTPLRLGERIAIAIIAAFALDATVCFLLSLGLGLGPASIILAPVLVGGASLLLARRLGVSVVATWQASLEDARGRSRATLVLAVIAVVAAVAFTLLLSRAMFQDAAGDLVTGYWIPDWGQHLITASSFSTAQNFPPQNPIMSGTPLYYPFLPDFTSGMLMRLGLGDGPSLWLPQVILAVVLVLLVVSLAERLGARMSVGVLTILICFLGGGLGFVGALHDACTDAHHTSAECSAGYVITNPADGIGITAGTLHALPGLVADQPTSFDGMTSEPNSGTPVFSDQAWYTPLFAWWLPQRTLMEGFDVVVASLVLLLAVFERARARLFDVGVAGLLVGLLPLIHVQSLFAIAVIAIGLAAIRWRRAWLLFAGVAALVAAPRVIQLMLAPHGSAALGNQYPWFEPGWMSGAINTASFGHSVTLSAVGGAIGDTLRLPFSRTWWGFWWVNLGVAVPLCLAVVLLALARKFGRGAVRGAAGRVLGVFPPGLLRLLLACIPIFVLCNVVIFQSWGWDNTKLLVYWYLGVALAVSAITVWLWVGWWRRILAVLLAGSVLATGTLALLRLLPYEAPSASVTGPYVVVPSNDMALVAALDAKTSPHAVFLVSGSTDDFFDPIPLLTGRPVVMGYYPWLWSYGLDYGQRQADVAIATSGCGTASLGQCQPILQILHHYDISYVEVNQTFTAAGVTWWAAQRLPVTASAPGITVYDVRGVS
jgi:hypothetical protein